MGGWLSLTAGAGGLVGVGTGWTNTTAWLAAGAVVAVLALIAWWITGPCGSRRRGRREELALRRYDLRGHPRSGRSNRPGGRRQRWRFSARKPTTRFMRRRSTENGN